MVCKFDGVLESLSPETAMAELEIEYGVAPELTAEMIRGQLELLVRDEVFRSSRRSVAFLRYVVEQTLAGMADQIKERAIGVEVFGRDPSYDTNVDHIVRTAATELRKRLATYYVDEKHRSELRMTMLPGSYIPRFTLPGDARAATWEPHGEHSDARPIYEMPGSHALPALLPIAQAGPGQPVSPVRTGVAKWVLVPVVAAALFAGYFVLHPGNAQEIFWRPVLDSPGPVLLVVGDHPDGPPTQPASDPGGVPPTPVPSSDASETVPFADTVTIADVAGVLEANHKKVVIRRGDSSSFSDLRQGPVVLIGAFNNEWSLRLTRGLRYSLAMDTERHVIYIRDAKSPTARSWSWGINQPRQPATGANSPSVQDFALISRIRDSETGHVVVAIGGLYTYGTQAAGEFLTDPTFMQSIGLARAANSTRVLQIVLTTTVTDGTPGPPRVLAISAE